MNISEKDLYKFVFNPEELAQEKFSFISQNIKFFISQISFLTEMKENMSFSVSDKIVNEINSKIEVQDRGNLIILNKIESNNDKDYLILAADSPHQNEEIISNTFRDNNGFYLAKINTTSERSKIFVFFQDKTNNHQYSLTINPSGDRFSFRSTQLPLIVKPIPHIESIYLKFIT